MTKVYSLQPYHNIPGYFIDIEGQPTFDPKHPTVYPGAEVVIKETLSVSEFKAKYDVYSTLYLAKRGIVQVLELTGRTSADVIQEYR